MDGRDCRDADSTAVYLRGQQRQDTQGHMPWCIFSASAWRQHVPKQPHNWKKGNAEGNKICQVGPLG